MTAFLGRGNGSEHKGGCTRVDNGKYMKQGLQRLGTGSPKTYEISGRIPPGSKETKQVGHWMLWRYGKSNPGAPLSHWTLLWCSLLKWIRSRLEVGSHCSHKSLRSCQIVWSLFSHPILSSVWLYVFFSKWPNFSAFHSNTFDFVLLKFNLI